MTATNRGGERAADDFYRTPAWCVWRLLEVVAPAEGLWLEPCAGDGAIVRAVESYPGERLPAHTWAVIEKRPEEAAGLAALVGAEAVECPGDFLASVEAVAKLRPRALIMNPPYSQAMDFVQAAIEVAPFVAALLRLNWLASAERCDFLRATCPDVYVIPNRPSFTADGGSDASEYAWLVWDRVGGGSGSIQVLRTTPKNVRRVSP